MIFLGMGVLVLSGAIGATLEIVFNVRGKVYFWIIGTVGGVIAGAIVF